MDMEFAAKTDKPKEENQQYLINPKNFLFQPELAKKLEKIQNEANFIQKQIMMSDYVPLSIFVRQELFDESGNMVSHKDVREGTRNVVHRHHYKVDFILSYPDKTEELMLHWGLSHQQLGVWNKPEAKFLPENSNDWKDGFAVQTPFNRE